jgi:hypothetical protein
MAFVARTLIGITAKVAFGRSLIAVYQLWLRYELFRGKLTEAEFQASEMNLADFIKARDSRKPHLAELVL